MSDDEFRQAMEERQRIRDDEAESQRLAKIALAAETKKVPVSPANLFEGLDLGAITDYVSSLPAEWQLKFRREVASTKSYIAKFADADPAVPLIEDYVFLRFVVLAVSIGIMAGRFDKKTAEVVDILVRRRTEMAKELGLTPREKRQRGGAAEATIATALEASQKAVTAGRVGRQERRDRVAQVLVEKTRDAARSAAQEPDNAPDAPGAT